VVDAVVGWPQKRGHWTTPQHHKHLMECKTHSKSKTVGEYGKETTRARTPLHKLRRVRVCTPEAGCRTI